MSPLVSIIIPTHRPAHFRNALKCALHQTYDHLEIIVSDNSGGSETEALCRQHPDVRYRRNLDGEPASNISEPLRLARGEFIKYLFDDDFLYPNCIDTMLGILALVDERQRAGIGLITSSRHQMNDDNVIHCERRWDGVHNPQIVGGLEAVRNLALNQLNFIGEYSTVLFRRSVLGEFEPLDIFHAFGRRYLGVIDVPLYINLLLRSNLLYIPFSVSAFRVHKEGGSVPTGNPDFHYAVSDWLQLLESSFEHGIITHDEFVAGARTYLERSANFVPLFPTQLGPFRDRAQGFLSR